MILLDKKNFEEEVLKSEGLTLVDFFGDGCVPCEALMPHVTKFSEMYGDEIKCCKLNVSKARRVAIGQQVLGLPTIIIYKDGVKAEELVKEDATPDAVEAMMKKYL
jgi:thioredoxin 1